jgi:glycosyltransferase involved in cell wall biosynthesis
MATVAGREHLLEDCRASVAAQTVPVAHLVGVDLSREGPATVRNRLAADSNADWLLPLDDDDLIDPDCVATLLKHADGADVVYPWCRVEDHGNGLAPWCPNRLYSPDALLRYNFIPVTALVSAELWAKVGGMPEGVAVEDWIFWKRCLAAGARFRCVDEVLWSYRRGVSGSRNEWIKEVA